MRRLIASFIFLVGLACGIARYSLHSDVQEKFEATGAALSAKSDVTRDVRSLENPVSPRSIDLDQPWDVGEAARSSASTIWLDRSIPKGADIRSAVVSEVAQRALVVYCPRKNRGEPQPSDVAVWINLARKTMESKWRLPIPLGAYSIHPSGKRAILRGDPFQGPGLETIYLVRFPDDGSPLMKRWTPLLGSDVDGKQWDDGDSHLTWVSFVGEDSIATINFRGTLHLWRLNNLEQFATFTDTIGLPDVTPDGNKIAVATKRGVALIDPKRRRAVGFHPITSMPKKPTLAFNPDGKTLGIIGDTSAIVIDLVSRDDKTLHTTHLENGHYGQRPPVGWIGDYLCTGRTLTDVSAGVGVWEIQGPKWTFPVRDAIWAILPEKSSSRRMALQCIPVSSRAIAAKVEPILQKSEALPWKAGKSVRVEVSRLPPEHQSEAREGLAERLEENGFHISDRSSLVLRASVGSLSKNAKDVTYKMSGDGQRWDEHVSYFRRPAILEIVDQGEVIWTRQKAHDAPMFVLGSEQSLEDKFDQFGQPDFSLYQDRLPQYVHRGQRDALLKTRLYAK